MRSPIKGYLLANKTFMGFWWNKGENGERDLAPGRIGPVCPSCCYRLYRLEAIATTVEAIAIRCILLLGYV